MNDEKCCCNCLHCARWKTSKGIECHCDLDDKYIGYLTVMDTESDCCKWEKETKWELQEKHDKEIYNKAIDDCIEKLCFNQIISYKSEDIKRRLERLKGAGNGREVLEQRRD